MGRKSAIIIGGLLINPEFEKKVRRLITQYIKDHSQKVFEQLWEILFPMCKHCLENYDRILYYPYIKYFPQLFERWKPEGKTLEWVSHQDQSDFRSEPYDNYVETLTNFSLDYFTNVKSLSKKTNPRTVFEYLTESEIYPIWFMFLNPKHPSQLLTAMKQHTMESNNEEAKEYLTATDYVGDILNGSKPQGITFKKFDVRFGIKNYKKPFPRWGLMEWKDELYSTVLRGPEDVDAIQNRLLESKIDLHTLRNRSQKLKRLLEHFDVPLSKSELVAALGLAEFWLSKNQAAEIIDIDLPTLQKNPNMFFEHLTQKTIDNLIDLILPELSEEEKLVFIKDREFGTQQLTQEECEILEQTNEVIIVALEKMRVRPIEEDFFQFRDQLFVKMKGGFRPYR